MTEIYSTHLIPGMYMQLYEICDEARHLAPHVFSGALSTKTIV